MKNFKVISYAICLFFICLAVSIFVKSKFGVEGDYLSAFTTLIATFVAYQLYTDWKLEHSLNLLAESQKSMKEVFSKLFTDFKAVRRLLNSINGSTGQDGENRWNEASQELNKLFVGISRAKFVIFEYKSCLRSIKENSLLDSHKLKVDELSELVDVISKDFFDNMPVHASGPSEAEKCIDILNSWESSFLKFDFYCSVSLPDFYYKYFKNIK
ncbi:hypothetical protein [Acinetobacter proteolyticus]|uniref:hypothetical protein n=1 Tax=Acinetobacter proteolyticus TaxID=1776741 RepID=UPI003D962AE9